MGMYVEVSIRVRRADRNAPMDHSFEKAQDELLGFLMERDTIGPDDRFDGLGGWLEFTSESFDAFDDVVNAAVRFVREHEDLEVEADFNYELDEYDCTITVTKDGVFRQDKEIATYSEPRKIRGIDEHE